MQWSVYWDRPQALINDYLESINGFIQYAYPNWGSSNRGVHAKGEYGTASLRADSMGLLDTEGRWILPQDSGATTTVSGNSGDSNGWITKAISIKTLEEAYYMFTGLQYNTSPIRVTESQWAIAGITTPVHSHLILSVLEEPFCYMSEPLVIEPEKLVDWNLRSTLGSSTLQGESLRVLGLICGQHHELIQLTVSSTELN
mgnify:CR=1 FL=1|tara:strand:+ start:517 stop:1116 length:600 start_codon:yes stop_codon:yes gene_type:complete